MVKLTGKAKAKFLARMKKGRKAAKGKSRQQKNLGKKSYKTKAGSLEKRIAELEKKLDNTLGTQDRFDIGSRDETEYHKLKKERREMDLGDW